MLTRNVSVQLKSDRISMRVVHAQLPRMRFPHRVVTGCASAMTRATSPMTTRAAELCYKSTRDPARPPIADRLRWPAVPELPLQLTDSRGVHVSRTVQCSAVRRAAWRRRWPPAMLAWRPTSAPPATPPTPVRTTKTSFPPVNLIVTIIICSIIYIMCAQVLPIVWE